MRRARVCLLSIAIALSACGNDGTEPNGASAKDAASESLVPDAKPAARTPSEASPDTQIRTRDTGAPPSVGDGAIDASPSIGDGAIDASRAPDAGSLEAGSLDAGQRVEPTGNVAPPAGFGWRIIPELSDEFEGTTLDDSKWRPSHPYWQGRAPSEFDPANVLVRGGVLELMSTTTVDSISVVANPDQDLWVKAACVASKQSTASYGYYEARIKASILSMTSSFWFQGTYSEIDVVEELGRPVINPSDNLLMQMNTHYFASGWANDKATPQTWPMPTGAADGFHTYGVWWRDKASVWFFHDGRKVAEMIPGGDFAESMYLFFDTEVFTWYGLPSVSSLKDPTQNTMQVDWVRAWTLVPAAP